MASHRELANELADQIRESDLFTERNADVAVNRSKVTVTEYDRPDSALADAVEDLAKEIVGVENYAMQTTEKEYTVRVVR